MTDVQRFIEKYARTPIGEINAERAQAVLRRSGFLTETGEINQRYADIVISIDKTQKTNKLGHEDQ